MTEIPPKRPSRERRAVLGLGLGLAASAALRPSPGAAGERSAAPKRPPAAGGEALRWSPPAQSGAITVSAGSGFYASPQFAPTQDVVIDLPKFGRRANADILIKGGRHVRIVGGRTQGRITWLGGVGSLYVEGVHVDMTSAPNKDALAVAGAEGAAPDVYLQNVLVTGVQGTKAGVHADVFQPYGPIGRLHVHGFTADTNYQGFFIRPANSVGSAVFSRVNMKFNRLGSPEGNTYLFWCRNPPDAPAVGDPLFPVAYEQDVYAEGNAREPRRAAAFPPSDFAVAGRDGARFAGVDDKDGAVRWPDGSGISGTVRLGPPPGGDFVTADKVGAAYGPSRSPG